jgi:opacity protein-like surface antigen
MNLILIYMILLFLVLSPLSTHAQVDKKELSWLEAQYGFLGSGINFKTNHWNRVYSFSYHKYDQEFLFDSIVDADGIGRDPSVVDYSVMISSHHYWSWGYVSAAIGPGLQVGEWGENCRDETPVGFFSTLQVCDIETIFDPSFGFESSATIGKYFGVGLYFRFAVSSGVNTVSAGINLPVGRFN